MGKASSLDDHWIERTDTLCEKDSRHIYLELLKSQLCWLFPEFVRNLETQSPVEREMSRVAVIEYQTEAQPEQTIFKSSKGLQYFFEKQSDHDSQIPKQRLFLLEDLALDQVEILGSQLRIPPAFFGAHWADPTNPTFNYRNPFCHFSEDSFVIRYASTQPVRIDAPPHLQSTIYRCISNVNRHLHCYDPGAPIVDQPKCYHALSFWTSGVREDGSWDCE